MVFNSDRVWRGNQRCDGAMLILRARGSPHDDEGWRVQGSLELTCFGDPADAFPARKPLRMYESSLFALASLQAKWHNRSHTHFEQITQRFPRFRGARNPTKPSPISCSLPFDQCNQED